jgi:hypothetical protein
MVSIKNNESVENCNAPPLLPEKVNSGGALFIQRLLIVFVYSDIQ